MRLAQERGGICLAVGEVSHDDDIMYVIPERLGRRIRNSLPTFLMVD